MAWLAPSPHVWRSAPEAHCPHLTHTELGITTKIIIVCVASLMCELIVRSTWMQPHAKKHCSPSPVVQISSTLAFASVRLAFRVSLAQMPRKAGAAGQTAHRAVASSAAAEAAPATDSAAAAGAPTQSLHKGAAGKRRTTAAATIISEGEPAIDGATAPDAPAQPAGKRAAGKRRAAAAAPAAAVMPAADAGVTPETLAKKAGKGAGGKRRSATAPSDAAAAAAAALATDGSTAAAEVATDGAAADDTPAARAAKGAAGKRPRRTKQTAEEAAAIQAAVLTRPFESVAVPVDAHLLRAFGGLAAGVVSDPGFGPCPLSFPIFLYYVKFVLC